MSTARHRSGSAASSRVSSGRRIAQMRLLTTFLAALLCMQCAPAASGRYVMATDPGSFYGFRYVREAATGRWIQREFEIRVDRRRELPPLKVASEIGNS